VAVINYRNVDFGIRFDLALGVILDEGHVTSTGIMGPCGASVSSRIARLAAREGRGRIDLGYKVRRVTKRRVTTFEQIRETAAFKVMIRTFDGDGRECCQSGCRCGGGGWVVGRNGRCFCNSAGRFGGGTDHGPSLVNITGHGLALGFAVIKGGSLLNLVDGVEADFLALDDGFSGFGDHRRKIVDRRMIGRDGRLYYRVDVVNCGLDNAWF